MQKIIGFFMIFSGSTGLGLWYSSRFQKEIKTMKDFIHILELFLGEIRFGKGTLPECCRKLSLRLEEPYKQCFYQIYEKSLENTGESFEQLCVSCLGEGLRKVEAQESSRELFVACFANNGYEEEVLQLRTIEQTRKELEKQLAVMETQVASRCRLAFSMGAMSGLLLIILLW